MTRPLTEDERLLLQSAAKGDMALLRILAWRVTNFNIRDRNGNTPLHLACERSLNREEAVRFLVDRREVSVNARNDAGETPFHVIGSRGDTRAVKALLAAHANPLIVDNKGQPPAHRYLLNGFHEGLEALLENFYARGLLINQQDSAGNTMVHLAAIHAPSMVASLVAKGGNPTLKNAAGELPQDVCSDKIAQRLLSVVAKSMRATAVQQPSGPDSDPPSDSADNDPSVKFAQLALDYISNASKSTPKLRGI